MLIHVMSAQRFALLKSAAKLLLFFEICKKICTFDADLLIFDTSISCDVRPIVCSKSD